jgi:hypothetical protein
MQGETEVSSLNEDLLDGVGDGVYIQCETVCLDCEQKNANDEKFFELRDDAGYQFLLHEDDK